jgi:CRISPR-associated endonuclease/helicase Cas3
MEPYFRYWGKARKDGEEGAAYHLLPYHCLDVAAVGVGLLRRWHRLRRFLAHSMGLSEEAVIDLFGYLLALHDLGKFARSFQGQREDLLQRLQGKTSGSPYTIRHDSLGYAYWQQYLWPRLKPIPAFAALGDRSLECWASAVMGHHGKPPIPRKSATNRSFSVDEHFDSDDRTAADEFADSIRGLLWNGAMERCLPSLDSKTFTARSRTCSWWLAGLTIVADWLGSNQDFFPYRSTSGDLREYWDYAQRQAEVAIVKTDLLPAICAPELNPEVLFDFLKTGLTPLQSVASTFSVAAAPQLFVLEDVTGAGKTEAAVILANRLMAAGQADGIYFALPTMATSNAMYNRIEKVYGQLFAPGTMPSLVLAHGAARMSTGFNASVVPIDQVREDERLSSERDSASARCNAWFVDHRKKALLAHVGVGTIDQALLAVLHSKHQSLRALGLFGKLLVVDEVHACDAYMLGLLEKLLTLHARGGGSALLLSATLPLSTRRKLANAFRKGLNLEAQPLQSMAYPLLTHIQPPQPEQLELPVATRPEVARKVAVDCLCDEEQVLNALIRTLKGGGCACWIRNTVADALESYSRLLGDERFDASRIHLFHARFTAGDRLRIEDAALARFGKESKAEQRAGHLLIATQVVEQSLDVDFDLLASDLAPIDLLIQRAGRLRRHARDIAGNPLMAGIPDQRGSARMIVFGPLSGGEIGEGWLRGFFPKASAVYPDHGQLWLTAHLLANRKGFRMPDDARTLVEGVYGEDAESSIPEALLGKFFDAEADRLKQKSAATYNAIDLDGGYRAGEDKWWEDNIALTRLGEETHSLLLARWQEGNLLPWHEGENGWLLSEIRVRQALLAEVPIEDALLERAVEELNATLPAKGRWSVLLPLVETEGNWRCAALDGKRRKVQVTYSAERGLTVAV